MYCNVLLSGEMSFIIVFMHVQGAATLTKGLECLIIFNPFFFVSCVWAGAQPAGTNLIVSSADTADTTGWLLTSLVSDHLGLVLPLVAIPRHLGIAAL